MEDMTNEARIAKALERIADAQERLAAACERVVGALTNDADEGLIDVLHPIYGKQSPFIEVGTFESGTGERPSFALRVVMADTVDVAGSIDTSQ